jgi:hypothetical protein
MFLNVQWLVDFNPQKTETMTISRKLNKPHQPNLIMNNTIISTVTEHKHLGLQLSDDGNWNKHIDMIIKKAFSRVNILRERPFNLNPNVAEKNILILVEGKKINILTLVLSENKFLNGTKNPNPPPPPSS